MLRTNLKLTPKQRKMKRLADKLWRDCIPDERKAAATYRRIAKELEKLELHDSAEALKIMVQSEETHMVIINDIIFFLKQRIQIEEIKYPKEAIEISRKYAGITGTVRVRYENGSIRLLPRRNYLMMRDAGRAVTLVS